MKKEDVDFEMILGERKIRLSELDQDQINSIQSIASRIINHGIFDCPVKALLCGFQVYLESIVETDQWLEDGNKHH